MDAKRKWRFALLAVSFAAIVFVGDRAHGEVQPSGIPDKIRAAEKQARANWQRDAFMTSLLIERDDANSPFRYDFTFHSSNEARLYHIKRGPKGDETGFKSFTNDPHDQGTMPSRIIDLPDAVEAAKQHGMKGNLVTADLFQWAAAPLRYVIIWRLVPDNDPNADPNDPNQKNYFVDAFTRAVYDPEKPNMDDVARGEAAMQPAVGQEMTDFVQSLKASK